MGATTDEPVDVRLLGGFALDGHPIALDTTRGTVLAMLLSRCNERVWIDELTEAVWPAGAPPSYRKAIQVAVFKLREMAGANRRGMRPGREWLIAHRGAYELRCAPEDVDAHRFERRVRSGLQHLSRNRIDPALDALRGATDAWAEPFGGDEVPCLTPWIERLRAAQRAALGALLEVDVRLGHEDLEALRRAVADEPYDERRRGLLMVALYRQGRQSDALQAFRDARRLLLDELGLEPGPFLRQVEQEILLQEGPTLTPMRSDGPADRTWRSVPPGPVPLLRESECAQIQSYLAVERLLTIVGPPGVGKTTVASAVARSWSSTPCAWVALGDVPCSPGAAYDIASRIGVVSERALDDGSFAEAAAAFIGDRPLLLVLDNVEHLVDALVPFLDALLRACPNLGVLSTARRPMGVAGERVHALRPFRVAPAVVTGAGAGELSEAARFLAARLGRDSANVVGSDVAAMNAIGRHLGGLAVGLEQAVVHLGRLTAAELADRLDLLTDDEQVSNLGNAIEWSLGLLGDVEIELLSSLAHLESSFTLERAEAIGGLLGFARTQVVSAVAQLVSESLVVTSDGEHEGTRRIIEPVRQHLRGRADLHSGERHRTACAVAIVAEVEQAARALEGGDQVWGVAELRRLMPDVRSTVVAAAAANDAITAARVLGALRIWWWASGTYADGQSLHRTCERLLHDWDPHAAEDRMLRVRALSAIVLTRPGFAAPAAHLHDLANHLALARSLGTDADVSWLAQLVASGLTFTNREPDSAEAYAAEALHRARTCEDRWLIGWALYAAAVCRARREPREGLELLEQATASFAASGDLLNAARVTMFRAHGLRIFGVNDVADAALSDAREWCLAVGAAPVTQLDCELGLAQNAQSAGRFSEAAERFRSLVPRLTQIGDDRCAAVAQRSLAAILVDSGDLEGANALVLRALEEFRRLRTEDTEIASACLVRAEIAVRRDTPEFAAKLVGRARTLSRGSGVPLELREIAQLDVLATSLSARLGVERFDELAQRGKRDEML